QRPRLCQPRRRRKHWSGSRAPLSLAACFSPAQKAWQESRDNPEILRALILQTVAAPHQPTTPNDAVQMNGPAGPPGGYARATILQSGNRQRNRALVDGRLRRPSVALLADQRRFVRCSNRAASHEPWAWPAGTRAKPPA